MSVVEHVRWTVETLLAHLLALRESDDKRYAQRFDDQKIAVDAALSAAKEAVVKAETAAEKRFEGVNEFRKTLDDQQQTLITRSEVYVIRDGLSEKIDGLTKALDRLLAERRGIVGGWGYAAGVAGLILTLLSLGVLVMKAIKP